MMTLRVVDHAPFPGGRFERDGPYSGEWFRDAVLAPAIVQATEKGETLKVVLDGAPGYGSSFLEEAFGGLVRTGRFRRSDLKRVLQIAAERKLYAPFKRLAEEYLDAARAPSVA